MVRLVGVPLPVPSDLGSRRSGALGLRVQGLVASFRLRHPRGQTTVVWELEARLRQLMDICACARKVCTVRAQAPCLDPMAHEKKNKFRDRELNPGLLRDRQKY